MMKGITATGATGSQLLVSGIMFGLAMLLSAGFVYLMFADPARLTSGWGLVRGLPLLAQIGLWAIFLPWMAALWIWNTGLAPAVRIVVDLAIIAGAAYLLFPWKG